MRISELVLIGLAYDIAGVVVLGWALAFAPDKALKAQAGTYLDLNSALLAALVEQRTDAKFGVFLLAFGFVLQFTGAADLNYPPIIDWILGSVLPAAITVYFLTRRRIVESQTKCLVDELRAKAERAENE